MKISFLTFALTSILLAGCVDNGKGPSAAAADGEGNTKVADTAILPYEGPGGGGNEDKTSPDMPASTGITGNTKSAFPKLPTSP